MSAGPLCLSFAPSDQAGDVAMLACLFWINILCVF